MRRLPIARMGVILFGIARTTPGHAADEPQGARGLISDLVRIVQSAEAGGWFLDEVAYQEILPVLLESVCRTTVEARSWALSGVQAHAEELGDPERWFKAAGSRPTPRFEAALTRTRRLEALERALEKTEDCPFWVVPDPSFRGRQSDRYRLTLNIETGGNIQLRQTSDTWTFGGGGLGRVLGGYGFSEHFTVLSGIEFGGGAMLRPGAPETEFVVNYFPGIPLVLRYRGIDWHYDLETGPVALFQADNTRPSYGARLGGAIGVYSLRTLDVIPWAGVAVSYEYYFDNSARPAAHFIRGGLRVGIIWDP